MKQEQSHPEHPSVRPLGERADSNRSRRGRRRRLLILTQHYSPEPNWITADVAQRLARVFDVTVVTAHPNYPYGRFYRGVRPWRVQRTVEQGVTVWRVPFFPDHSRSHLRRAVSYLSFAAVSALLAPIAVPRPDTVWVYHGPFTTALASLWFRWVLRSRVVFTCADLWPESFLASGVARAGFVVNALYRYSRAINRVADTIICSTRGTLERFQRDGIARERLTHVPVWTDGIHGTVAEAPPDQAVPRVVYAGNLGPAQALDTVIQAAAILQAEQTPVRFDLYGAGACEQELRTLAAQLDARNVVFHGRCAPEECFAVSSSAFAQIVSLRPDPAFRMTLPSKLSFALAAGAPILAGLEGEAAAVARESGGAVLYRSDDASSFAASVRQLLQTLPAQRACMRRQMTDYYAERFARDVLLERYVDLLGGEQAVTHSEALSREPLPA
jgi:glycosyltransferase involved in cell wall biosynthesis